MTYSQPPSMRRRKRYRSGQSAEMIAAAYLMARGHRILARRFKTGAGEIDLITLKARRVGFVEVKRRATVAEAEASITEKVRQRVRRAFDVWLSKNPVFQQHDIGFDLMFVVPWRMPVYQRDAL